MATGFYAGLVRGPRRALLLGPYNTQEEADAVVGLAHEMALEVDPFCHFDTPGTFRLECERLPFGRLNGRVKQNA